MVLSEMIVEWMAISPSCRDKASEAGKWRCFWFAPEYFGFGASPCRRGAKAGPGQDKRVFAAGTSARVTAGAFDRKLEAHFCWKNEGGGV